MNVADVKRVAVVDDDPLFLDQIASVLTMQGNLRVEKALDSSSLYHLLDTQNFHCVVLDYNLGRETGLSIGQNLRDRMKTPPPVVLLTGAGSERTAAKAFRMGFSDYVSKRNLNTRELVDCIRSSIKRGEEELARSAEQERLKRTIRYDSLTGLRSSFQIKEHLEQMVSADPAVPFMLLTVEIARLRELRMELGYRVTERLIREFARRLQKIESAHLLCGHYSNDVFAVISTNRDQCARVNEVIGQLVEMLPFEAEFDRVRIKVEARIGNACAPANGRSPAELVASATGNASDSSELPPLQSMELAGFDVGKAVAHSSSGLEHLDERRRATRHRVLKRGKIIINGLNTVIDCTVRDLSETGARIRVDSYFAAPEKFYFEVVGTGTTRAAETRWQSGNEIGLEFVEPRHD